MKLAKCLLLLTFGFVLISLQLDAAVDNLGPNAANFGPDRDFGPEDEDDIDPKILRKFIEDQGLIESRNKEGRLTIAGDVRTRWTRTREWVDGVRQRGFNSVRQTAVDLYKTEINLILDYVAPTSWAESKIKFAFYDGKDGGTNPKVEVDRAWIGYEIYEDGDEEFYIEVGRNRLDTLFDSKVEFTSVFDGLLLTYRKNFKGIGFYDIHGGPFVVDSYTSHYAWVGETSLKGVLNTGFAFKYSIIDWQKASTTIYYGNLRKVPIIDPALQPTTPGGPTNSPFTPQLPFNPRYRFLISQALVGYEFKPHPFLWCKTSWFYAGGLINTAARGIPQTRFRKENLAWFIGYTIGKLKKQGDWSVDMNYQYVQMQAVPDFDAAGIGHGNAQNQLFSDSIISGLSPSISRGFANYRGFEVTGLYALTDSLSLKMRIQHSSQIDRDIGGTFVYNNLEVGAIFAF